LRIFASKEVRDHAAGGAVKRADIFELHADVCKTLSHPSRLKIIALLGRRELSVGELAGIVGISLPNASQHLALLKAQGLVRSRKDAQSVHYSLTDRRIIQACTLIRSVLLDRMKERGSIHGRMDPRYVVFTA
jgi:ArsR family transcriptional regulator